MEKTYSALIERLKKSYNWHIWSAEQMEKQPGLTNDEKLYIIAEKAIVAELAKIIQMEEAQG